MPNQVLIDEINGFLQSLGLSMTVEFVPFSKSKDKDEKRIKYKTLNWAVTILKNGKPVLTTPWSMGIQNSLTYQKDYEKTRWVIDFVTALEEEIETGKVRKHLHTVFSSKLGTPAPILIDVMYSLSFEADTLNYNNFDDFASAMGYGADSIKAKAAYDKSLEIGLRLRNGIGNDNLEKLMGMYKDY